MNRDDILLGAWALMKGGASGRRIDQEKSAMP
jgi:hypothetical protein